MTPSSSQTQISPQSHWSAQQNVTPPAEVVTSHPAQDWPQVQGSGPGVGDRVVAVVVVLRVVVVLVVSGCPPHVTLR